MKPTRELAGWLMAGSAFFMVLCLVLLVLDWRSGAMLDGAVMVGCAVLNAWSFAVNYETWHRLS